LILLLFIPDLPRFDDATAAEWTLLDGSGATLRTGAAALRDVPRGDRTIAVAPVNHLLFIETALPQVSLPKRNALLRYAIEDKLTIDPSTVHAVVLGRTLQDRHVVAAIDRSWLSGALSWLKQASIEPDSLVSSASAISMAPDEWAVAIEGSHGFAKRADGFVYNFDTGSGREPPFGLTLALKEARDHQVAPASLSLHAANTSLAADWSKALGLPVKTVAPEKDGASRLLSAARTSNLLSGEFAPRQAGSKWFALLRPALTVLALIAAVQLVFTLIENARLNRQYQALQSEMTQIFKQAFPAAQAIVDPPLQMRRNLDQLKNERGQASDNDPRALVAQLTQLAQSLSTAPAIVALQAQNGAATLDLDLASAEQETELIRAVAKIPAASVSRQAGVKAPAIRVRVSIKAGS
jgi:general secretion pathway protein L